MDQIAYIFPGQGSQHPGMGKDLADNFAAARRVFEEADDALGFELSELCFAGSESELALTENTQPAILTVSIAALRAMQAEGFTAAADYVAGHSLGEYSALVAAGGLSFADAVRTVRARGRYMQSAVPVGFGAMAAILGADAETVSTACAAAAGDTEICSPANINSPSQTVIAGHAATVDRACELLKERGAKRAIKLNVSAPFHCALMLPAQENLARDLAELDFSTLNIPLMTNVDAELNRDGDLARESLIRQVSAPVRWLESVENLWTAGARTFIEIGAGKILSGLVRQIRREAICLNIADAASLQAAQTTLASR